MAVRIDELRDVLSRTSAEFRVLSDRVDEPVPEPRFIKGFQKCGIGRLAFRVEELVPKNMTNLTLT